MSEDEQPIQLAQGPRTVEDLRQAIHSLESLIAHPSFKWLSKQYQLLEEQKTVTALLRPSQLHSEYDRAYLAGEVASLRLMRNLAENQLAVYQKQLKMLLANLN